MTAFVIATALVLSAVVGGILLGTAVGAGPMLDTLPDEAYVRAKQFAGSRMDPLMPIMVVTSGVMELVGVILESGTTIRVLTALACLATAAVVVISQLVNAPINRWIARLDPTDLPGDFAARDPRPRWHRANLARTVLALTAVLADLVALTLLVQ